MRRTRQSTAARRMPGKPSRLFTERPSAAKAAPAARASSGRISGSGFVSAKMPCPRRTRLARDQSLASCHGDHEIRCRHQRLQIGHRLAAESAQAGQAVGVRIEAHHRLRAHRAEHACDGRSRRAEPDHADARRAEIEARTRRRVQRCRQHGDRRPVLVVVEDRHLEALDQPSLHLEACRRLDVLELDGAEALRHLFAPFARSSRGRARRAPAGRRRARRTDAAGRPCPPSPAVPRAGPRCRARAPACRWSRWRPSCRGSCRRTARRDRPRSSAPPRRRPACRRGAGRGACARDASPAPRACRRCAARAPRRSPRAARCSRGLGGRRRPWRGRPRPRPGCRCRGRCGPGRIAPSGCRRCWRRHARERWRRFPSTPGRCRLLTRSVRRRGSAMRSFLAGRPRSIRNHRGDGRGVRDPRDR